MQTALQHARFLPVIAPWVSTTNFGDKVIRDSMIRCLAQHQIFASEYIASHDGLTRAQARRSEQERVLLVGGSNLLSTAGRKDKQFPLSRQAAESLHGKLVLFGVGWRIPTMRTEDFPNSLWTRLLHPDAVHGVRDAAAAAALKKAGFTAVVTGCPSLLDVPRALGSADPDCAVVTVTAYAPDIQRDQALLEWVRDRFRTVYLQPQGPHDVQYAIERLAVAPSEVLPNTLDGYTAFLIQRRPTYVGTRLHGGIRALQLGLPAVILAVDDRAPGLGTPFSLPIAHTVGEINDVLSRLRCQGAETINTTLVIDRITSFLGSLKSLLGSEKLTHPEAP